MGPQELIIIGIVALVVIFGAKKIPEMARSMGRAQSEFKKGMKEGQAELEETPPVTAAPPVAPTPATTPPAAAAPPPAATPPAASSTEPVPEQPQEPSAQ